MSQPSTPFLFLPRFALVLLLVAAPAVAAPAGVSFHDVATEPGLGLDYERTPSQNAVIWDQFRQMEFLSFR